MQLYYKFFNLAVKLRRLFFGNKMIALNNSKFRVDYAFRLNNYFNSTAGRVLNLFGKDGIYIVEFSFFKV